MIRALVLTATLLLATTSAQAWEANFRRCDISKILTKAEIITHGDENESVTVTITPEDIPALTKGFAVLKQCDKFWACVAKREAGEVKHCYLPRSRG
jgi:hypothetical protein